ncbi:site-specific DNA-methyltransferase (cytosine-N4-specific) [Dongia mobilis]|uniref:Methyltransferase n=1 Tax=Dongia mobilis TaxID=578943 RepID=A0A4R6WPP4_9PROT|nr:site-specific DNA-methyltransferase [Dongia mobilis]TDQ83075.1 site-specific DNA-methyltransferase (cytosine-N4-specific) [Dongia mobilis]
MSVKVRNQVEGWPDIHPSSSQVGWVRPTSEGPLKFSIEEVSPIVGLQPAYVRKVLGTKQPIGFQEVERLLLLDDAAETFVPRSRVAAYLELLASRRTVEKLKPSPISLGQVVCGDAHKLIPSLDDESIDCVVTSSPYWAVRIYGTPKNVEWADGEICPYGHEQTPEAFIRHSVEMLHLLMPKLATTGSIWWNVGDTFNTRTQIRGNAAETLRAMKGLDRRKWTEQNCRRYSAGHAYLFDGEQCLIPQRIAERASRIGYLVKSVISWNKDGSMPEPTASRVTRSVEHIIHLSKVRNPVFDKAAFRTTPAMLGGRNSLSEQDKVTDVWNLPTSSGGNGHGAQFPLALPGRCISLSTRKDGLVLDPFAGSGTSGVAAIKLGRRFVGFDVSSEYVDLANYKLAAARDTDKASSRKRPPSSKTSIRE